MLATTLMVLRVGLVAPHFAGAACGALLAPYCLAWFGNRTLLRLEDRGWVEELATARGVLVPQVELRHILLLSGYRTGYARGYSRYFSEISGAITASRPISECYASMHARTRAS